MINQKEKYRNGTSPLFFVFVLLLASFFVLTGLGVTGCTTTPPWDSQYTEETFTVYQNDFYRSEVFLEEGESLECYWTSSDPLTWWYRNSYGSPTLIDGPAIGTILENGNRVKWIWEPGDTLLELDEPLERLFVEVVDADGNIILETSVGGSCNDEGHIEADRTGYYTLCFDMFDDDIESVDVTLQYRVH